MSAIKMRNRVVMGILLALCLSVVALPHAAAQNAVVVNGRKAKNHPDLVYPELARKMNISGTVKVEIVIEPNGTVKSAKAVGGHPLLIDAAVDAAKKFKFETATEETTGVLPFEFKSQQ